MAQTRAEKTAYAVKWHAEHREASRAAKRRHYYAHQEEIKAARKAWREANPEVAKERNARRDSAKEKISQRRAHLKHKFGLTLEQYDELLVAQGNCCAVCGRDFASYGRTPHVDHCHDTGRVRGLLCAGCNIKIEWCMMYWRAVTDYVRDAAPGQS